MAALASPSDHRFCMKTPLAVRDHDLAEMSLALHVPVRILCLGERKYLVDDGFETIGLDGAVHGLEHLPVADIEALDAEVAPQDRHRIDLCASAGQQAD